MYIEAPLSSVLKNKYFESFKNSYENSWNGVTLWENYDLQLKTKSETLPWLFLGELYENFGTTASKNASRSLSLLV